MISINTVINFEVDGNDVEIEVKMNGPRVGNFFTRLEEALDIMCMEESEEPEKEVSKSSQHTNQEKDESIVDDNIEVMVIVDEIINRMKGNGININTAIEIATLRVFGEGPSVDLRQLQGSIRGQRVAYLMACACYKLRNAFGQYAKREISNSLCDLVSGNEFFSSKYCRGFDDMVNDHAIIHDNKTKENVERIVKIVIIAMTRN